MAQKKLKNFGLGQIFPKLNRWPLKIFFPLIERMVGLTWLNKQTSPLQKKNDFDIFTVGPKIYSYLNIDTKIVIHETLSLSSLKGKIIVANHDGLLLDSLFLISLLNKYTNDYKFVATSQTSSLLPFKKYCFFIDISVAGKKNNLKNFSLYRKIIRWLKEGKTIVIFPETHHEIKKIQEWAKRLPWSNLPNSLARAANTQIIPIKLTFPAYQAIILLRKACLFFYNARFKIGARVCFILCGLFSIRQLKFSSNKAASCIIGNELSIELDIIKQNNLRDYIYSIDFIAGRQLHQNLGTIKNKLG